MHETTRLVLSIVVLFGGSLFLSYCIMWLIAAHRNRLDFEPGTVVRMVGPGGAYRCHFQFMRGDNLVFSSPIQADRYVPIRVGERLLVQAPGNDCLITFRSNVLERDSSKHELVLEPPTYVRRTERRSEDRRSRLAGEDALMNGEVAEVVDLSAAGTCLLTYRKPVPGERVRVVLPSTGLDAFGWTLDCSRASLGTHQAYRVRVQFEEPLAGLGLGSRSADG